MTFADWDTVPPGEKFLRRLIFAADAQMKHEAQEEAETQRLLADAQRQARQQPQPE